MSDMPFKRQGPAFHDGTPDGSESVEPLEQFEAVDEVAGGAKGTFEMTESERLELRVRGDLEDHGITGGEAARLSEVLTARLLERGPEGYEDLVAGAQMISQVRTDLSTDLADSHRELRQLERLMGGFATELRKLDEVIEVLAVYMRRMRDSASDNGRETLH